MEVNIFGVLMKKYKYARQKDSGLSTNDPFVPDYTCRLKINDNLMKKSCQQNSGGGQISRSLSNSRYNLRNVSRTSGNQGSQDPTEPVIDCSEFKFERSLGNGQTGGTYRYEFHGQNILHNDIRKENILVNEKGDIYFIDFGKSIVTDKKKLFLQEKSELSRLLGC
ncbi:12568_t:CDS:2 [Funneliformis mosseae]|uniref:12568_t:CDS:1 n=1 Tax=Funneliformis mosseae TaxID=27381 RepID=A0A9N9B401_FUNMO|nr:12568_t:CDS:2 [Funneliformis mosseae]